MKTKKTTNNSFPMYTKSHWWRSAICFLLITALFIPCSSSTMNTIAQAALNPTAYYQKVEKDNLNKQIDSITENYSTFISTYQDSVKKNIGSESTVQVTLDKQFATELGLDDLNNIKFSTITMAKGLESKSTMSISSNDKELASLEAYSTIDNLYYILIPGLSKAYLGIDNTTSTDLISSAATPKNLNDFLKDPASEEVLNKLLKKYSTIAINKAKNVTMKKTLPLLLMELNRSTQN